MNKNKKSRTFNRKTTSKTDYQLKRIRPYLATTKL